MDAAFVLNCAPEDRWTMASSSTIPAVVAWPMLIWTEVREVTEDIVSEKLIVIES